MVKARLSKILAVSALSLAAGLNSAQAKEIETNTARLQAMDKMTGKVSVIEVPVNGEIKFGSFSIVVRACKTRPPEEMPDNFAFVDVVDEQQDGSKVNIFKGWMISSSPALHAVEHPIYDVWLLQCIDTKVDKNKLLTEQQLSERDVIEQAIQPEPKASDNAVPVDLVPEQEEIPAPDTIKADAATTTEAKEQNVQVQPQSPTENAGTENNNRSQASAPENIVPVTEAVTAGEVAEIPAVEDITNGKESENIPEETVFESEESYTEDGAPQPLAPFADDSPAAANMAPAEENQAVPTSVSGDIPQTAPENILNLSEEGTEDLLPPAAEQESVQPQPLPVKTEEPSDQPGQLIEFDVDEGDGGLDAEALR